VAVKVGVRVGVRVVDRVVAGIVNVAEIAAVADVFGVLVAVAVRDLSEEAEIFKRAIQSSNREY
jgi:hypothetical protein